MSLLYGYIVEIQIYFLDQQPANETQLRDRAQGQLGDRSQLRDYCDTVEGQLGDN